MDFPNTNTDFGMLKITPQIFELIEKNEDIQNFLKSSIERRVNNISNKINNPLKSYDEDKYSSLMDKLSGLESDMKDIYQGYYSIKDVNERRKINSIIRSIKEKQNDVAINILNYLLKHSKDEKIMSLPNLEAFRRVTTNLHRLKPSTILRNEPTSGLTSIFEKQTVYTNQGSNSVLYNFLGSNIKNEDVRDISLDRYFSKRTEGLCFGATLWALALYYPTLMNNADKDLHTILKMIANSYKKGISFEAILVQIYHTLNKDHNHYVDTQSKVFQDVLGIKALNAPCRVEYSDNLEGEEVNLERLSASKAKVNSMLDDLEDGAYIVNYKADEELAHAMALFKKGDSFGLLDSNIGLLENRIHIEDVLTYQLTIAPRVRESVLSYNLEKMKTYLSFKLSLATNWLSIEFRENVFKNITEQDLPEDLVSKGFTVENISSIFDSICEEQNPQLLLNTSLLKDFLLSSQVVEKEHVGVVENFIISVFHKRSPQVHDIDFIFTTSLEDFEAQKETHLNYVKHNLFLLLENIDTMNAEMSNYFRDLDVTSNQLKDIVHELFSNKKNCLEDKEQLIEYLKSFKGFTESKAINIATPLCSLYAKMQQEKSARTCFDSYQTGFQEEIYKIYKQNNSLLNDNNEQALSIANEVTDILSGIILNHEYRTLENFYLVEPMEGSGYIRSAGNICIYPVFPSK